MKKLSITTAAAAGLSAAVLGLAAPALAAPTGTGDAQATICLLYTSDAADDVAGV